MARYYRLSAILDSIFRFLQSKRIFIDMPDEIDLAEEDHIEFEDDPSNADDINHKDGRCKALPTYGKARVVDFHHQQSAYARIRREHQVMQLGMSALIFAVGNEDVKVLKKTKRQNPRYMEKLFTIVFRKCSTRREMLERIQDLLMVCRDVAAITDRKNLLKEWIKEPEEFLDKVRRANSGLPVQDYNDHLFQTLHSKFKKSSYDHLARSLEREYIIVRVVVFMQLLSLQKTKGKNSSTKAALAGLRRQASLVEAQASLNRSKRRKVDDGPSSGALAPLENFPSILSTLSPTAGPPVTITTVTRAAAAATTGEAACSTAGGIFVAPTTTMVEPAITVATATNCIDVPYDDSSRWQEIPRLATQQEMASVVARLVIETEDFDIHLYHSPAELYQAWDLKSCYHQFEVLPKEALQQTMWPEAGLLRNTQVMLSGGVGTLNRCRPHVIVARPGCSIYDESFSGDALAWDLRVLVQFVFEQGTNDPSRSSNSKLGSRLDFGNAGLAMEPGKVYRPKTLCGTDVFFRSKTGETIRVVLGRLVEGMCRACKRMAVEMGRPFVLNERRYLEFADHLRSFLFADEIYVEWITIQVLNLSDLQSGTRHKDDHNDERQGYNWTACKSFTFVDSLGSLWSLKIIINFRKRIGDYMLSHISEVLRIKAQIKTYQDAVDARYRQLFGMYKGAAQPSILPTCRDLSPFYLDDYMPFETQYIFRNLVQDYFTVVTAPTRSLWISAACTAIHRVSPWLTERGMIQLAMVASWQNSFHYFWEVLSRFERSEVLKPYPGPAFLYHDWCVKMFGEKDGGGEFIGGPNPRYSPIGFNFRQTFDKSGDGPNKVESITTILLGLLNKINEMPSIDSWAMEELLEKTTGDINAVARCELGLFRLQVFLQFCAHLRIRLHAHPKLREILFPVKTAASHGHITSHGFSDEQVFDVCEMLKQELSEPSRVKHNDELEVELCESTDGRLLQLVDVFIKGQGVWSLDDYGCSWVKPYGSREATRVQRLFTI